MPASTVSGNFGVGSWVERRARIAPDDVALIAGDRSFTYAEVAGRVRRLANGLRRLGVAGGDRVAWLGPNHPAFLESLFAAGLLGAALAPVNHRLDAAEVRWVLEDSEPSVLIQHHAVDPMPVPGSVRHRVAVAGPLDGSVNFEALVAGSADDAIEEPVGLHDLCLLPHTSGTTGRPKGVMLTHGNVIWNVVNFLSCADFRSDDVTIAIAPFFRVGGTGVNVLPVLFVGGTVVVPGEVTPDEILRLTERHRVSVGFGNPDILDSLAQSELWPIVDLSSIRFLLTGGAPVPERLIRTYLDRGLTLLQGYGLSEAAPLTLLLDPKSALRKIGSAGTPPLLVDVRIVSPTGADVGPDQTGELLVRGPNVMAGYWNRPEETRTVVTSDGWLRTGDAARVDGEGYVWIVGRVKDRFTSQGQVVYPGDVERLLVGHPAIADAGVVDVPAPGEGRVGRAFVVLAVRVETTEQELLAFCRQHLAPHQVPGSVTLVERLPRNSVGKLIRAELRALASRGRADRTNRPTSQTASDE
jgi:acyl-CoA synthetase (AMP-forming)/AMP-acid ligase II